MDSERVPEVVHPGLIYLIHVAGDIGHLPKSLKTPNESRSAYRFTIKAYENICCFMLPTRGRPKVIGKHFMDRRTDGNHSCAIRIGTTNFNGIFREINVSTQKRYRLAHQYTGCVQNEQEGPECFWGDCGPTATFSDECGIEQTAYFFPRIDVRNEAHGLFRNSRRHWRPLKFSACYPESEKSLECLILLMPACVSGTRAVKKCFDL